MAMDLSMPVLVVDDYNTMIRIMRNLLRQLGFTNIDEACDGRTALAKMQSGDSIWRTALALFEKAGHDEAYALQQFRLARVLRTGEYDPKTGGLTLWTPPAATRQSKKVRR